MTESESPLEPSIVGIDGVEVPFYCVGADLGDLFSVYYRLPQRPLQKEKRRDGQSVGWTPSEDAAMVRSSVEVTMVDDVEDVETASVVGDPKIAASASTTSSVAGLSVSKSEKTSSTAASSDCHVTNQSTLAQLYAQFVGDPKIAASASTTSSVAGLSVSKSEKTSSTAASSDCHVTNQSTLAQLYAQFVGDPKIAASASTTSSVAGLSVSKSEKTSSTAASSDCHVTNQSKKLSLAQLYAQSVAANPKRHLYTTLLICAILTIAAIVGAVVTELKPEIDFKSWLTRGSLLSNRAMQQYIHLNQNMEQNDEFFLEDGQIVDIKDPPNSEVICSGQWYGSPYMTARQQLNLVTVWKTQDDSQNALDSDALYQMCMNEEHVLQSLEENDLCYKCPVESNEGSSQDRCIQPYSLVAAARLYLQALSTWSVDFSPDIYLQPSLSCNALRAAWTERLQSDFTKVLLDCTKSLLAEYNLGEPASDSSPTCLLPDAKMVASLVDVDFPLSGKVEYTTAIYASKQDTDSLDELYILDKSSAFSQEDVVLRGLYEVGIQPLYQNPDGGFYMRSFEDAIGMDVLLSASACAVAGLLILWHTKSLYLTLFGLLQIVLALPISWLLYRFVFGFESFSVINLCGMFIAFALGADDVFVMVDKWKSTRAIMARASTTEVAIISLPSAITATLMTSFTTSVGFFATNASDVTGIKLFGIFCGLLIVLDYILSVLLLSPVLCLYDRMMMSGSPSRFVTFQKSQVMDINASSDIQERDTEEVTKKVTVEKNKNLRDRFLGNYIDFLYEFRWSTLLVSVSTIIACSFVASTFKPPDSEPLPSMLPVTNPYEAHSKFVENLVAFPLRLASDPKFAVQVVFGVQAVDNGSRFDPSDSGSIVYDDDFDASNNQQYLLEFCDRIDKPTEDYSCVLQEFDSWLQLQSQSGSPDDQYMVYCDGETSIPVSVDTFDQCFIAFSELTNSKAVTYDYEAKKVKTISFNTRVDSNVWSPPAALEEDWHLTENWSIVERSKAPEGANKFFISSFSYWYLDTFNNVVVGAFGSSLIVISGAALVILSTSRSLTLAFFSGISILYVLVAATASLAAMGWSLGLFESILFAILVGLGSDFIMHFAHAYSMIPGKANKQVRMKHAILHMGPSVLGSAATTLSTAIIMLFCKVATLEQFATMMVMTMVHSLIGSFVIFSVLCLCFGPAEPARRFDFIRNKVMSRLGTGNVTGPHAGEDVPKFVDVDDVNSSSRFRAKRWMVVLSYLAAAIITLCISIGAYSFVRSA